MPTARSLALAIDEDGKIVRIETANMSIQAEIEAKVAALVDGVAELVRRVALQAAEEVLSPSAKLVTHAAAPSRPRTATRPAPKPMPQPARRPAPEPARAKAPHAPPAPAQRSLKEPRRGRLVVVPSAPPSEQSQASHRFSIG